MPQNKLDNVVRKLEVSRVSQVDENVVVTVWAGLQQQFPGTWSDMDSVRFRWFDGIFCEVLMSQ